MHPYRDRQFIYPSLHRPTDSIPTYSDCFNCYLFRLTTSIPYTGWLLHFLLAMLKDTIWLYPPHRPTDSMTTYSHWVVQSLLIQADSFNPSLSRLLFLFALFRLTVAVHPYIGWQFQSLLIETDSFNFFLHKRFCSTSPYPNGLINPFLYTLFLSHRLTHFCYPSLCKHRF